MGKITKEIREIQEKEELTLPQLFEKYPMLARLQYEELQEEKNRIDENKKPELLLG